MYNEIRILSSMLKEAGLPHVLRPHPVDLFGYQLVMGSLSLEDDDPFLSAIQNSFSYGGNEGLIEIMNALTEEEFKDDNVLGWLTAEEVFKRFKYCWENKTITYKEVK